MKIDPIQDPLMEGEMWCDEMLERSKEYRKLRKEASENRVALFLIFAARLKEIRQGLRSNSGVDMCRAKLLEDALKNNEQEIIAYYSKSENCEADYKGLEKVIDAIKEKIQMRKVRLKNDN